jgi:hypothetical protein
VSLHYIWLILILFKTPNFAMTVNDVPRDPPVAVQQRLTLQHLIELPAGLTVQYAPNNTDARLPQDRSQWPTDLIIDFLYGSAALKKWGMKASVAKLTKIVNDVYYSRKDQDEITQEAKQDKLKMSRRDRHSGRKAKASGSGAVVEEEEEERNWEDIMDIVHAFWLGPQSSETQFSRRLHDTRREKVEAWLQKQ